MKSLPLTKVEVGDLHRDLRHHLITRLIVVKTISRDHHKAKVPVLVLGAPDKVLDPEAAHRAVDSVMKVIQAVLTAPERGMKRKPMHLVHRAIRFLCNLAGKTVVPTSAWLVVAAWQPYIFIPSNNIRTTTPNALLVLH